SSAFWPTRSSRIARRRSSPGSRSKFNRRERIEHKEEGVLCSAFFALFAVKHLSPLPLSHFGVPVLLSVHDPLEMECLFANHRLRCFGLHRIGSAGRTAIHFIRQTIGLHQFTGCTYE